MLMALGYLLGSIPFGYILGILFKVDITKVGSGNIGATNVTRALGKWAGIVVLVLDLSKGTLAVILANMYLQDPMFIVLVGLCAILGHMYSIFLKFNGGKGAATGVGVLLGIAPDIFFFTVLIFILVVIISRYVSLASIVGAISATIITLLLQKPAPYFIVVLLGAILIIYQHKENIARLISGTESKFGENK